MTKLKSNRLYDPNFTKPPVVEHERKASVIVNGRARAAKISITVIGKSALRQACLIADPDVVGAICNQGSAVIEMFGRRKRIFVCYQWGLDAVINVTLPLLRFAKVPATHLKAD